MYWLNEYSRKFLKEGYLSKGETPEQRIKQIAKTAGDRYGDSEFGEKFLNYLVKGYYSLSSPVWANFGVKRACPISCFGSFVEDSMDGILSTAAEVGMMTKIGGGTSAYFGDVRSANSPISGGGKSEGVVPFLRIYETISNVCKQTEVRRGSFAAYLPIDHGDIEEFLKIRHPKHPIQHIFPAVTVPDYWMESMIAGDTEKRRIWAKVIKSRVETGVPYVTFIDNVNKYKPKCYQDSEIYASNLCNEIALPSSKDESFVCCLSSINLVNWDELVKTDAIECLVIFLNIVMEEFIEKAESIPQLDRALNFAKSHKALGMGVLGWHSYLQEKGIPFESMDAMYLNSNIFSTIQQRALECSESVVDRFGFCDYAPRANTTLTAIAPTTSSSFILGQVSQSIEPFRSNYYSKDLAKILHSFKNPNLKKVLKSYGKDTDEIWDSIRINDGSVQHLDFLSDKEKQVYKTFGEISQGSIIAQAAQRQKFIDQSQSLNILLGPDVPAKEINALMIEAWKTGVKGLYYQHSYNASQKFYQKLHMCKTCEG